MLRKAKSEHLAKVMNSLHSCIETFSRIVTAFDFLPGSKNNLARLMKVTFLSSNGTDEEDQIDNDEETVEDTCVEPNSESEKMCLKRGFSCLSRLSKYLLRDGKMVQIALIALETLRVVSRNSSEDYEAKSLWITQLCNGENLADKTKKNSRVIAELLKIRNEIEIEGSNVTDGTLTSTCSLTTSISAESKYFDGTELTQNEGVESQIKIILY